MGCGRGRWSRIEAMSAKNSLQSQRRRTSRRRQLRLTTIQNLLDLIESPLTPSGRNCRRARGSRWQSARADPRSAGTSASALGRELPAEPPADSPVDLPPRKHEAGKVEGRRSSCPPPVRGRKSTKRTLSAWSGKHALAVPAAFEGKCQSHPHARTAVVSLCAEQPSPPTARPALGARNSLKSEVHVRRRSCWDRLELLLPTPRRTPTGARQSGG